MTTYWKISRMRGVGFGALVATCLATNATLSNPSPSVAASLALPFAGAALTPCDIDCDDSELYCPSGKHDAWDTTPNFYYWTRNGGVHAYPQDCRDYSCGVRHGPYCPNPEAVPMSGMDIENLRNAIQAEDGRRLAKILEKHSQELTLNVERSAVQLLDCNGAVVMHLPVAPAVLESARHR